ncbi:MAG TPA: TonB-dependent receptor [Rhizomicrobium sp.]|nr:TonB-dependent receptor [Rhizomicrobium sp.]
MLLSSALAAPAFAQIEEVVVTAQKKSEDIQSVPIAVTAYTAQDLAAHQITAFKDLQFATPNVTYSQGNFGGANFQVRGIGITAVGGGSESGVAINFADVFLAAPPTDGATFYDLQDLEVLRGPQSTLYGRGATGGVVNVAPNRPVLDAFSASGDVSYGNYNAWQINGMVNIPIITDELGVRLAGQWISHDGFTTNIADGSKQNDRSQWGLRGSVRWQPSDRTTVDLLVDTYKEDDHRARADKELCANDPTGVLGCTPASPQTGDVNLNSTYLNILASKQGVAAALSGAFGLSPFAFPTAANPAGGAGYAAINGTDGAAGLAELGFFLGSVVPNAAGPGSGGANVPALLASLGTLFPGTPTTTGIINGFYNGFFAAGAGLASAMGLTDTSAPYVAPPNSNPSDYRKVNDDFNPINKQQGTTIALEVKQNLTDWLDATFVGGATHGNYFNQQSYTNTFGPPLGAANLAIAEGTFLGFLSGSLRPDLAAAYAPFFTTVPGQLPVSDTHNLGISSGAIHHYSPNISSFDQASGNAAQQSAELRFNSKFEGPVNFMIGGYYLKQHSNTNYFVQANSLDYASILLGGITADFGGIPVAGLIGPSYYHNIGRDIKLKSQAVFGEVYWDIVPDLLKLTVGARYNEDYKSEKARIGVLSGFIPLGSSDETAALDGIPATQFSRANGSILSDKFDSDTGRVVLDWSPKLDFTDRTLVYASYSRGYKAGGFNPGIQTGTGSGLSPLYGPESIDAYELGTKNILLDGHLQANADVWYYNYQGLQVSAIIDNTSINQNIAAKLYGVEGEFVWLPTDNLQFNLNFAKTHSGITNTSEVDTRNPTGGDPRAILVKDNTLTASANQNCVIYDLNPGPVALPSGYTLVPSASGPQVAQFVAPPGGQHALAGVGVANAAYGSCSPSPQLAAFLAAQGYSESDPAVPGSSLTGVPVNLNGNQLQQTPDMTISVGAQYTFNMDGGYSLVPRVDYYWQSHMWGRIFHTPADLIKSWDVMNAQLTLNSPDNVWYAQAFVKNVFDKTYVTGEYLTSSSSGLYTNAFLGDPRTYGIRLGIRY